MSRSVRKKIFIFNLEKTKTPHRLNKEFLIRIVCISLKKSVNPEFEVTYRSNGPSKTDSTSKHPGRGINGLILYTM